VKVEFAQQYGVPCVAVEGHEDAEDVISFCNESEAKYFDGEESVFVLRFPDGPRELYTERALRLSFSDVSGRWNELRQTR